MLKVKNADITCYKLTSLVSSEQGNVKKSKKKKKKKKKNDENRWKYLIPTEKYFISSKRL